jgi:hypothetical protein
VFWGVVAVFARICGQAGKFSIHLPELEPEGGIHAIMAPYTTPVRKEPIME